MNMIKKICIIMFVIITISILFSCSSSYSESTSVIGNSNSNVDIINTDIFQDNNCYLVKFLNEDGSVFKTFNVSNSEIIDTDQIGTPKIEDGFHFVGWKDIETDQMVNLKIKQFNKDTFYMPVFKRNTYMINIDIEGDGIIDNKKEVIFGNSYDLTEYHTCRFGVDYFLHHDIKFDLSGVYEFPYDITIKGVLAEPYLIRIDTDRDGTYDYFQLVYKGMEYTLPDPYPDYYVQNNGNYGRVKIPFTGVFNYNSDLNLSIDNESLKYVKCYNLGFEEKEINDKCQTKNDLNNYVLEIQLFGHEVTGRYYLNNKSTITEYDLYFPIIRVVWDGDSSDDSIKFGYFEQDNNPTNGKEPIDWICIGTKDGKALLTTLKVLDCAPLDCTWTKGEYEYMFGAQYQTSEPGVHTETVSWETSTLRKYLNDVFINTAFSSSEQKHILNYETEEGVIDKVFILSEEEYSSWLLDYYKAAGWTSYARESVLGRGEPSVLLRPHGVIGPTIEEQQDRLYSYNSSYGFQQTFTFNYLGIRPCIWVALDEVPES